jgi:hypothetical protein
MGRQDDLNDTLYLQGLYHRAAQAVTAENANYGTHNPKVAGSNRAPATIRKARICGPFAFLEIHSEPAKIGDLATIWRRTHLFSFFGGLQWIGSVDIVPAKWGAMMALGGVECPSCGKSNLPGARFCYSCGCAMPREDTIAPNHERESEPWVSPPTVLGGCLGRLGCLAAAAAFPLLIGLIVWWATSC